MIPSRQSRSRRGRAVLHAAGAALLALSLGGCLSRGPDTTGSVGEASAVSEATIRQRAEELGRRFEANPADTGTAVAYARVLRALDQNNQAVAVLQSAAIRNPDSQAVLGEYGKALADAGRFREAADVLARAHSPERPDWRILSVQGAVADGLGDVAGAQRLYEAALRIAPGEPSILANQGLSLALANRLGEAERVLTGAAAHPRADSRVRRNLALVLGLQGRFSAAEEVLRRDLPPAEVADALSSIKAMISGPNSWKAIRQSGPVATPGGRSRNPAARGQDPAPAGPA